MGGNGLLAMSLPEGGTSPGLVEFANDCGINTPNMGQLQAKEVSYPAAKIPDSLGIYPCIPRPKPLILNPFHFPLWNKAL